MNQRFNDALKMILGEKPSGYYITVLFFALIATILSWYLASRKRDIGSPNTPTKFSWTFLIVDNLKKGVVTLLLIFVLARLFDLSNIAAMLGVGFFVSFGLDKAIQWLMNKVDFMKILQGNRSAFVPKDEPPTPETKTDKK